MATLWRRLGVTRCALPAGRGPLCGCAGGELFCLPARSAPARLAAAPALAAAPDATAASVARRADRRPVAPCAAAAAALGDAGCESEARRMPAPRRATARGRGRKHAARARFTRARAAAHRTAAAPPAALELVSGCSSSEQGARSSRAE